MNIYGGNTKHEEDVLVESLISDQYELVLYNDEVNTFLHVIECLVKYCKHDELQAEQCAWIVHTKGKCAVMSGELPNLLPVCEALCDQSLSAAIEAL